MTGAVAKSKAIVIFINQIREKIGVMFGNPETTPGGKALKFFSSYRIEVRSPRGGKIEEKDLEKNKVEMGIKTNVKIVKNKLYPPFRVASFNIIYGHGIDRVADAVEFLNYKRVFGDGRSQIKLAGKSYTKKTLIKALHEQASPELKKALMAKLKEVSDDNIS
jgi:recombination protein RecA